VGGFQPLFGTTPQQPAGEPQGPTAGAPAPAPSGGASSGFTPLFGSGGAPDESAGRPPGFTPLGEALGLGAPAEPAGPGPQDLEVLLAEAREEGAASVRDEAEARINEMQATLDALAPALDEVARVRTDALRQASQDLGALVLTVCRRVLGDSLAVHPDALANVVSQAVANLPDEDDVRIRVNPDDVPRVRDALPDRLEDHVESDPTVTAGCKVESRHAAIDATLAAAVEGIEGAVQSWLESQS